MSWTDHAACKGIPTDEFFPNSTDADDIAAAKRVCARCPVIETCREVGATEQGIWGGLTLPERVTLQATQKPKARRGGEPVTYKNEKGRSVCRGCHKTWSSRPGEDCTLVEHSMWYVARLAQKRRLRVEARALKDSGEEL